MSKDDADKNNQDASEINWSLVYKLAGGALTLWVITFLSFFIGQYFPIISVGNRGTFGDMFGGLNTLFTGAAFIGIIITVLLQRKELKQTHKAIEEQRAEMKAQISVLKLQQFENTFFSLLKNFNYLIETTTFNGAKGRIVFDEMNKIIPPDKRGDADKYVAGLSNYLKEGLPNKTDSGLRVIAATTGIAGLGEMPGLFGQGYKKHLLEKEKKSWNRFTKYVLGPYFNSLFSILKFVNLSDVQDKAFYLNVVKGQISTTEAIYIISYGVYQLEEGNSEFADLLDILDL